MPVFSLLLCSAATDSDDEFDFADSALAHSLEGHTKRLQILKKKKERKRKAQSLTISGPTGFRHDVHLGPDDMQNDHLYMLWDADRWRLELAKKDLILPPMPTPHRSGSPSSSMRTSTISKRNSYTPQKRKPVPSLHPAEIPPVPTLPESLVPQEVPLPPSPSPIVTPMGSEFDEQESPSNYSDSSLPPLDPPSRGPSFDGSAEDDEFLNKSLEMRWEQPVQEGRKPAVLDPIYESALQLQT
ncbi:hypothetical protein M422DRAFT_776935 [Sphaerobolus stellatus SS14]|nr:hypothetical protein M422DRAFT_776935 [Sphaerobolus stellatus SS14]